MAMKKPKPPKKEKAPPISKPTKSGGGKQKKKVSTVLWKAEWDAFIENFHGRRGTMATGSDPNTMSENKGKMIMMELDIVSVPSLRPTHYNKTIEAIVYCKWTSKHVQTRQSTKYCCMLIDKQGNPIQNNMNVIDTEYFDLLQLHKPQDISSIGFPAHYFNFAAHNELEERAESKTGVLTVVTRSVSHCGMKWRPNSTYARTNQWRNQLSLQLLRDGLLDIMLSGTSATHYYLNPDIPETYQIRQMHTQLTDVGLILDIQNERFQDPEQERTRNRFP
ncbi:hypothetical protein Tco_0577618 [Tanacetum coccineum]